MTTQVVELFSIDLDRHSPRAECWSLSRTTSSIRAEEIALQLVDMQIPMNQDKALLIIGKKPLQSHEVGPQGATDPVLLSLDGLI